MTWVHRLAPMLAVLLVAGSASFSVLLADAHDYLKIGESNDRIMVDDQLIPVTSLEQSWIEAIQLTPQWQLASLASTIVGTLAGLGGLVLLARRPPRRWASVVALAAMGLVVWLDWEVTRRAEVGPWGCSEFSAAFGVTIPGLVVPVVLVGVGLVWSIARDSTE